MDAPIKLATDFMLAAKRAEIHGLEQLGHTCELVSCLGQLIHLLQRERGASNLFLASGATRFGAERVQIVADCDQQVDRVRVRLSQVDTGSERPAGAVRLFSRIAWLLHGLDGLPGLRGRVAEQDLSAGEATDAYGELISGLLAVVFEAADAAGDPAISRTLVALFQLMQGKELAGQERATGSAAYAAGRLDSGRQYRLQRLIEGQARCFEVFFEFAPEHLRQQWVRLGADAGMVELERMRRTMLVVGAGGVLDPALADRWFACCSARLDAMRAVEEAMAAALQLLCSQRIRDARVELDDQQAMLARLVSGAPPGSSARAVFIEEPLGTGAAEGVVHTTSVVATEGVGPELGHAIVGLLQHQSQRLQAITDELATVRATLNERKLIERAKGLLMTHRGLSEDEAYRLLRQTAMNQNRRLADVAAATLSLAELLPGCP